MAINRLGWVLFIFVVVGCANVRNLPGGVKDEQPPVLIAAQPPQMTTHFSSPIITLQFDEYITLNDVANNLIISPPPVIKPKVSIRKKSVILEWKDEWLPNTTYSFHFGEAIADLNENNVNRDIQYVISTGDVIDSMALHGWVKDVMNDQMAAGVKVMAFTNDSSVFSKKGVPLYFTRSDSKGKFQIPYMRAGEYFVYGLQDSNNNYRYDEGEALALLSHPVNPLKDTSGLYLHMSIPRPTTLFLPDVISDSCGTAVFSLNGYYQNVAVNALIPEVTAHHYSDKDSLFIQLSGTPSNQPIPVQLKIDTLLTDTLLIPFYREALMHSWAIQTPTMTQPTPHDRLPIQSKQRIQLKDEKKIKLFLDSSEVNFSLKYDSLRGGYYLSDLASPGNYTLSLASRAFENEWGGFNDSLSFRFTKLRSDELARLVVQLQLPDDVNPGLLTLFNAAGKKVFQQADIGSGVFTIEHLLPGEYTLQWLQDDNRNGYYDPLNIVLHQAPEFNHCYPSKIALRANWDFKIDWKIDQ